MDILADSLGLVSEGDTLSIAAGLVIGADQLIDVSVGARHWISVEARQALLAVVKPVKLGYWLEDELVNISVQRKLEIINFLDSIGGLKIKRSFIEHLVVTRYRFLYKMFGLKLRLNARRYPGTVGGLISCLVYTMWPLALGVLVVVILGYGANLNARQLLLSQTLFLGSLFVSTLVHELVHLRLATASPSQFIVRGFRIGLLHSSISNSSEICSALLGPLAGLALSVAIALAAHLFGAPVFGVISILAVGLFHLLSLWPSYGDGATLLYIWKARYA